MSPWDEQIFIDSVEKESWSSRYIWISKLNIYFISRLKGFPVAASKCTHKQQNVPLQKDTAQSNSPGMQSNLWNWINMWLSTAKHMKPWSLSLVPQQRSLKLASFKLKAYLLSSLEVQAPLSLQMHPWMCVNSCLPGLCQRWGWFSTVLPIKTNH